MKSSVFVLLLVACAASPRTAAPPAQTASSASAQPPSPGWTDVDEVARLVRLTSDHRPEAGDDGGALLCDADLSVLGGEPGPYARYLAAVREDYAHIGDADFAAGRAAVVRQLLALDPLFHTERARQLWLDAARRNLQGELA